MKISNCTNYSDVISKLKFIIIFVCIFGIFFPNAALSETVRNTKTFDPNSHFWGSAYWTHEIPRDFLTNTADIKLKIRVYQFNDWGTLDLFCSNSSTFNYGSATTATGKPGFIRRISRTNIPNTSAFYEISGTLNQSQLEWLNDDGVIHLALIGDEYRDPAWGGYKAIFYLEFSELTAIREKVTLYSLVVNSTNPASEVAITSATGHEGTTSYTLQLPEGTSAYLTAPEYHGTGTSRKSFMSWSGDISSNNQTINVNMNGNKTVTANYVDDPELVGTPDWIKVPPKSKTGSYMVSWDSSSTSGVTYMLEEATNDSFTTGLRQAYSGTATSAVINDRSIDVTYYYRVKAIKTGYADSVWKTGANGCLVRHNVHKMSLPGVLILLLDVK